MRRAEIANAKLPHFSRASKLAECLGDFVRVHEPVRPMKLEKVDAVDSETSQGTFASAEDVFLGKVVAAGSGRERVAGETNAALRRDYELLSKFRMFAQHFAKSALCASIAVDVRVIEQRETRLNGA